MIMNRKMRKEFLKSFLWSISPTFYERICANILVSKKVQTFNVSTKKLRAKLLYEKAPRKMLVKLRPGCSKISEKGRAKSKIVTE
jgi:hypothetical protein